MEKRDSNPYDLKTHEEAPSNYLSAEELINYFNSHGIPFERSDNLPRFCDNHKIKMIKEQREGSEGSVPTMYEKISSDKLETIKNSLKSINNSFLGREFLKKKKALILKIFDDAPLTKKYDEKLDALPESGASNYTGETKKKRKEIVKEKREKCVSYSKIAGMVADKLACQSNRKYVRKILEASRSSLLEKKLIKVEKKLSKIS